MRPILIANGDSWTFGSEIMAPEFLAGPGEKGHGMGYRFKLGHNDHDTANDYYRLPRIWPTILAESIDADIVNISWPSRSNDSIVDTTIGYLLENYIVPGKNTHNIVVVIGWSSPERKNLIYEDGNTTYMQTIWPAMSETKFYFNDVAKRYFKLHVSNLWTPLEYIARFIDQNFQLLYFCRAHGIKYHCFNAFYETPGISPNSWKTIDIDEQLKGWDDINLDGWQDRWHNWYSRIRRLIYQWRSIPESTFFLKDVGSFKGYIDTHVDEEHRMINWHPSPESHHAWAMYLSQRIKSTINTMGRIKL